MMDRGPWNKSPLTEMTNGMTNDSGRRKWRTHGNDAVITRQRYSWCRGILSGFPTISLRERLSVLLIGQLHTRF